MLTVDDTRWNCFQDGDEDDDGEVDEVELGLNCHFVTLDARLPHI